MKITAHLLENKHICLRVNDHRICINEAEMQSLIDGKETIVSDSTMIRSQSRRFTIYPYFSLKYVGEVEQIPVTTITIWCNTVRLFLRIRQGVNRVGVDKKIEFNIDSFHRWKNSGPKPQLNFCQILKHERFKGRNALLYAVKHKIPWQHFPGLRSDLCLYLADGFTIQDDFSNTPNFRFYGAYPGGIIYHGAYDGYGSGFAPTFAVCLTPSVGWSVHT
jgi:hypothetical protein